MLRKDLNEFSRTFRAQVANFNKDEECLEGKKKGVDKNEPHFMFTTLFFCTSCGFRDN